MGNILSKELKINKNAFFFLSSYDDPKYLYEIEINKLDINSIDKIISSIDILDNNLLISNKNNIRRVLEYYINEDTDFIRKLTSFYLFENKSCKLLKIINKNATTNKILSEVCIDKYYFRLCYLHKL